MAILSGSRGPAKFYYKESDIDISLILDEKMVNNPVHSEKNLLEILSSTIDKWRGQIGLDTALLFSINDCNLECFYSCQNKHFCEKKETDCFEIYKIQKGYCGFIPKIGLDVNKVFPIKIIWSK